MIFISVRLWNHEKRKPETVGDMIIDKSISVGEFKKYLVKNYLTNLDPNQLLIIEEETELNINFMKNDNASLEQYR